MTHFRRALSELNVDILCAKLSQTKGRVERANRTLRDRLMKELQLADISDLPAGIAFLPVTIEDLLPNCEQPLRPKQCVTVSSAMSAWHLAVFVVDDGLANPRKTRVNVGSLDWTEGNPLDFAVRKRLRITCLVQSTRSSLS